LKKGKYEGAVADYSEAIRLDPANAGLYEDRARAYRAAGDSDRALRDERKAQELQQ
jgi:Flp pilus assembly protein TadD